MSRALATLLLSLLIVGASAAQTATDPFAPLSNPAAWTPDRVCRVTAEAGELVWDFEADKTVSGAIAIRAEGLSLPKPEILSFQVLTPDVGYLLVTIADRDGTWASYQCFGLPNKTWTPIEITIAEPWFYWADGADGQIGDIDSIILGIEPRAGEVRGSGRYQMRLRDFRSGPADKVEPAPSPSTPPTQPDFSSQYQKFQQLYAQAVEALTDMEATLQSAQPTDHQLVTLNVARDALGWSALDAAYANDHANQSIMDQAVRQVQWIIDAAERTTAETAQPSAATGQAVSDRPDATNLTVRNGDYYAGDRPVILTGMQSPWSTNLRPYGYNAISRHEFSIPEQITAIAEEDRQQGLALDFMSEIHVPGEWYEQHPTLDPNGFRRKRNPFMAVNIDSEALDALRGPLLTSQAQALAKLPHIASLQIVNELWYAEGPYYQAADFQQYLRQAYDNDIETLNRLWDTDFADFDEVRYVPRTRAARVDMGRYTAFRVTRQVDWEAKQIHQVDPNRVVLVKVHGGYWSTLGADYMGLAAVLSGNGMDNYPEPILGRQRPLDHGHERLDPRFAADFWTQAVCIDTYCSLAPNKPIIDGEYHIAPYDETQTPPQFVRAMFWQASLHGRDAAYMWIGQRRGAHPWISYDSGDFLLLTQPWMLEAAGRTALDLERLAEHVIPFHHRKADVALLRSGLGFLEWYKQAYFQDCPFDLLLPDAVEGADLAGYKLLLIPNGAWVSPEGLARIEEFVKRGGHVAMAERSLEMTEREQPLDSTGLRKLTDRVVVVKTEASRPIIDRVIERADIRRPIRCRANNVEFRLLEDRHIAYAINFDRKPQRVVLEGEAVGSKIVDLITGRELGAAFELAPLEVVLLQMPQ